MQFFLYFVFSSPKKEKQPKVQNVEQQVLRQEQKNKFAEKNKVAENKNQPKNVQPEKKEAVQKPVEIQPEIKKVPVEKKSEEKKPQPVSKPEIKKDEPKIASVNPPAKAVIKSPTDNPAALTMPIAASP